MRDNQPDLQNRSPEKRFHSRTPVRGDSSGAFTLIELLAVIGTLAVIILTLFPVLANTRPGSRNFACLNNTRRLTLAWLAYVADNADVLP
jgi:type II secretory pathway pseudopilin PulG